MIENHGRKEESLNLDRLRACLFSRAKAHWGWGLVVAHLAIISVPIAKYVEESDWLGPSIAGVLLLLGKVLVFRSEVIRADAERLHRAKEFERGIGKPLGKTAVADLLSRYQRYERQSRRRQADERNYYEELNLPIGALRLTKMIGESAWWTHQLAEKACNWVACVTVASTIASMLAILVVAHGPNATQLLTAYTIVICLVIVSESLTLGARYWQLHRASRKAFDQIHASREAATDVFAAVMVACEYQVVRSKGPLIPNWFWRMHREVLQRVWVRTLSDESTRKIEV